MTDEWQQPAPKTVPIELTPEYPHAVFTPEESITERMSGVPVMDRLDDVMRNRLTDWAKEIR